LPRKRCSPYLTFENYPMNQLTFNTSPVPAATHPSSPWQIERVSASVDSVVFNMKFAGPVKLTQSFLDEFRLAAERAPDDATWRPKFEMNGQLAMGVLVRFEGFEHCCHLLGMLAVLVDDGLCDFADVWVASVEGRVTLQLEDGHSFVDAKLLARQMALMTPGLYDTRHLPPNPWIGGMGNHQGVSWQTYALRTQSDGAEVVTFAFQAEVKDVLSGQRWRPEDLHTLDFRHLLNPIRLVAPASSAPVKQSQPARSFGDRVVAALLLVRWPSRESRLTSVGQHGTASSRKDLTSKYLNKRMFDAFDRLTTRVNRC